MQVQKLFWILIDFNIFSQHLHNPVRGVLSLPCARARGAAVTASLNIIWDPLLCRFYYCSFPSIFRIVGVLREIDLFFSSPLVCKSSLPVSLFLSLCLFLFNSCHSPPISLSFSCHHTFVCLALLGDPVLCVFTPCEPAVCQFCCSGAEILSRTRHVSSGGTNPRQQFCSKSS